MKKKEVLLIIFLIALALVSRFLFIEARPLHNDEGVNAFFGEGVINLNYHYDPYNYHGPLYFFLIGLSFLSFGYTVFALRLPAVLIGIILCLLPLFLKYEEEYFNKKGKMFFSVFIILSPSILYYSRYSIMEIAFVLFSFLTIYFYTRILEKKSFDNNLHYFAISLALLFTIKETVIIILFVLFVLSIFNIKRIINLPFKKEFFTIITSVILFLFVYLLFFTNFFSYGKGFVDSIKGNFQWLGRGVSDSGHFHPFYYFLKLIGIYELPLIILGVLGLIYSIKTKNVFYKNISLWFIIVFLIYSFIPYKTPWLIINITLPLGLLSALGVQYLNEKIKNKKNLILIIAISLLYLLIFSINLNYVNYYQDSKNFYAYAHTEKDILNLVTKINKLPNQRILFLSKDYWPLPFYLRSQEILYSDPDSNAINSSIFANYDYIVFDGDAKKRFNITDNYKTYYLRPNVPLYLYKTFKNSYNKKMESNLFEKQRDSFLFN